MSELSERAERILVLIDADLNNSAIERELTKEGIPATREYVRQVRNMHCPLRQSSHKHKSCSIISEDKLTLIIKDLDSGMTYDEFGDKYGMSGNSLLVFLKRHGLKKKPGAGKRKEAGRARRLLSDAEFLNLYKSTGGNLREIARQSGVHHLTALNAAKRLGLSGIGRGGRKKNPRKLAIASHLYHSQGWSIHKISRHLKMGHASVSNYVKEGA